MPKHSRSRSRDSDRKSKKSHKHSKDSKKHKKHSRSRERRRDDDSRGKESDHHRSESRRDRNEQQQFETNGHHQTHREESKRGFDSGPVHMAESNPPKKTSRFSDQPLMPPAGNNGQSRGMMPPPTQQPQKRRKFVWTDADENELLEQQMKEKRSGIDESSPALMIGSNPSLLQNLNPAILSALQDSSKIKKKIYLPKNTGINYIGLLIGPRGLYQKRLEEESGCKILIRGKGSQKEGSAPQPDDDDEQHVLIIGDSSESVRRAVNAIERVISADEGTRNKIREEQLVVAQQINNSITPNQQMDDSMMTPYGPPSPYAYIIPVPNDCVGLIIGKGGDTIRQLQMESGAKIQVAKKEIPNSNLRNVFVEGPPEKYQRAKDMIDEIIKEHKRTADPQIHVGDVNPFSGPHSKIKVPDKFVGLIIGKNGENLRGIAQRSNTKIFVPQKNNDPGAEERTIEVDGDTQNIEITKQEIQALIQRYMSQSSSSTYDYSKNPYGSGIAVYNQQKLANDGQSINGAVPDALKPESGSYASNLLTENPMLAYNAMQLTGWSYDQPNGYPTEGQDGAQQQQYGQEQQYPGYDQAYYQNYQQQYPAAGGEYPQQAYDPQQYQEYYNQYYAQQQQYQQPEGQTKEQNPESTAQPSTDADAGQAQQQQTFDYNGQQYTYDQYQQYYQNYYYGQPGAGGDPNAYYQQQQYYPPQQVEGGAGEENQSVQEEKKQEPGQ